MQKWSDHAPVILQLSGMTKYPGSPPPPCPLSSRAIPKHGLQALFQQKALTTEVTKSVHNCVANAASNGATKQPEQSSDLAKQPQLWPRAVPCDTSAPAGPENPTGEAPTEHDRDNTALKGNKRQALVKPSYCSGSKQQKVTGFFQRK